MTVKICRCGKPIPPQTGPGMPRKHCPECSPSRKRDRNRLKVVTSAGAAPEAPRVGPMFASTLLELRAAGREGTPEGLAALKLAEIIDFGGGTAAGCAAAVRQFIVTKDRALAGAEGGADVIEGIFGADSG